MTAIADLVRVELVWYTPNGHDAYNVLHVLPTATPTDTILSNIGAEFKAFWKGGGVYSANGFKQTFPSNLVLSFVRCTAIGQVPEIQHTTDVSTPNTSGIPVPPETAITWTLRTSTVGRSYRGRVFWPPIQQSALEGAGGSGLLSIGSYNVMNTDLATLFARLAAINAPLVVYSKLLDVATAVTSTTLHRTPHHQSRRNAV